jgi:hypothetical protein
MKKILTYLAVTLLLMQSSICVVNAAAETVESDTITISAEETITDTDQICTILTAYFEKNGLNATCFYAETYDLHPEYAGKIVVEFNYADSIGTNYGIDYDHLMAYLIEQNIPIESIRVVPLLNGEPYVQEVASDTKVNENVLDAFASGAQSVEVYIVYKDIPVGEISAWAREQAAIYAEKLDRNVYSEEEIINMEFDYYTETVTEALKKERSDRTTEILTVIGVDPASAICDEKYPRLSCVLTQDQVQTAQDNDFVRLITLKSEWKSADLGITTAIPDVFSSTTTTTTTITEVEKIIDEAQPFTATLDDDFITNKLALMFKYDFTKQDIETTIAPKLIESIGNGKLKEFEYLDTVNIDDESSRQMYIALLDLEDSDKQSAYEIAADLYETGYFYSVEMNMVGIPSITETTTTTITATTSTTTATTTITTDGTNTDLPQTGINSVNNILITITALLLTATGAGAVYSSGILRRKEDDK